MDKHLLDPWIELLRVDRKSRRKLFHYSQGLMKRLAKEKRYPDVAAIRGLLALCTK